ncbi:MAG: DinB family protein [Anaerolineae bacterium]|nr:DinB family protein [Anaerolineae bacterium]
MTHPLVLQLRFARSEFVRGLDGVTEEEGRRRFEPMNSISWMVAHLTWQEQRYWLTAPQGVILVPEVNELAGYGQPATTPSLAAMWAAWRKVTQAADVNLETLNSQTLTTHLVIRGETLPESLGSMLRRMTYHYWYHIGESQAVRQLLGHKNLPDFVGAIHAEAPYIRETD